MLRLERAQWPAMRALFVPEEAGPLVGLHTLATRRGEWWVDRWPAPRAAIAFVGGNAAVRGDPAALRALGLVDVVGRWLTSFERIFIDAPAALQASLAAALPGLRSWRRVILDLVRPRALPTPPGVIVRRLRRRDAPALHRLEEDVRWISDTTGGPAGLAASQTAFGAFARGRLASVAAPFFVGERHEDIGVVTAAAFRGRGLSPACAARVVADIRARGRRPTWSTAPENAASLRVAAKLGFRKERDSVLYVAGKPLLAAPG
jgi:GNAT superfamily N-acetyltransferase